jgi:hypothetical protein
MTEYAQGGYTGNPGDDSIPIMVHPGESWMTADQVSRYGVDLLRKLNGGGAVHVIEEVVKPGHHWTKWRYNCKKRRWYRHCTRGRYCTAVESVPRGMRPKKGSK